jgi:NitT/TauT family transport system substrate-binding protein
MEVILMRRLACVAALLLISLMAVSAVFAREVVPVRIGYIAVAGGGQIFVIDGEGWARDAGLELKLTQFDSGPNAIQGLASGTIDVYAAGIGPLAVARSRGVDVRVVTATAIEELAFVAGGKLAAQFGQGGSAADAFARFSAAAGRPAKLATQPAGSVPNTVLQHWLWEAPRSSAATSRSSRWGSMPRNKPCLRVRSMARQFESGRSPSFGIVIHRCGWLRRAARCSQISRAAWSP